DIEAADHSAFHHIVDEDRACATGQVDLQAHAIARQSMADNARALRQCDLAIGCASSWNLKLGGRSRWRLDAGRAVDKGTNHGHKSQEQYTQIDDDEADQLAPDPFNSRVE